MVKSSWSPWQVLHVGVLGAARVQVAARQTVAVLRLPPDVLVQVTLQVELPIPVGHQVGLPWRRVSH